ncbi:MAG: hypothetical protein RLN88_08490 [Ekhidna sp.]|uniref:hypothetical protein n=1 Tax=Ekhidna sp. TaxID=2608089 RepID=UPI0032F07BC9
MLENENEVIQWILDDFIKTGGRGESPLCEWLRNQKGVESPMERILVYKMIYTLELLMHNDRKTILVLAPKAHQAIEEGGYEQYLANREEEERIVNQTARENLQLLLDTNSVFKRNQLITVGAAIIALLSLIANIVLGVLNQSQKEQQSKPQEKSKEIPILKSDTTKTDSLTTTLKN